MAAKELFDSLLDFHVDDLLSVKEFGHDIEVKLYVPFLVLLMLMAQADLDLCFVVSKLIYLIDIDSKVTSSM